MNIIERTCHLCEQTFETYEDSVHTFYIPYCSQLCAARKYGIDLDEIYNEDRPEPE